MTQIHRGIWFIFLYNIDCPNYIKKDGACNHPNKKYRPKKCNKEACPIKQNIKYCD